jgi:hypothetical protein
MNRLHSKIVSVSDATGGEGHKAWVLCEDGSMWLFIRRENLWVQVHAPHELRTKSSDLAEALKVLRRLAEYACLDFGQDEYASRQAFDDAYSLLNKHGA